MGLEKSSRRGESSDRHGSRSYPLLSARFGRNQILQRPFLLFGVRPIIFARLVAEKHVGFHVLDRRFHPDEGGTSARNQNEIRQVFRRISQRCDLRGQAVARPSDRLTISPPAAVPCCPPRTARPSNIAYSKSRSSDNCSNRRPKTSSVTHRRMSRKLELQLSKLSQANPSMTLWSKHSTRPLGEIYDCPSPNDFGLEPHWEARGELAPADRRLIRVDPR